MTNDIEERIEKGIFITHFFNEIAPEKEELRKLSYLTTDSEGLNEEYYFLAYGNYRKMSSKELEPQVESGEIIKLPEPVKVKKRGEITWIDKNRIVYIADHKKPWSDPDKRAVYNAETGESLI